MTLQEFFQKNPKCALAFSGGVDSAFLLWAAVEYGCQVQPYFVKTQFQPAFELEDAKRLCSQLNVPLKMVEKDILSVSGVAENSARRCYHCKTALMTALQQAAAADGYPLLLDGTNASDQAGDRPGMQALRELGVCSPLQLCGLTKQEIRRLSKEAGLFTWEKPAYACLATRFPTGDFLTADGFSKVEAGEEALFSLGFTDFRLRVFHGAARLQLPEDQLRKALEKRQEILQQLKPLFREIFLDLEGRESHG